MRPRVVTKEKDKLGQQTGEQWQSPIGFSPEATFGNFPSVCCS